jgi:hypothetical protein
VGRRVKDVGQTRPGADELAYGDVAAMVMHDRAQDRRAVVAHIEGAEPRRAPAPTGLTTPALPQVNSPGDCSCRTARRCSR